jgi:hypothetical protein
MTRGIHSNCKSGWWLIAALAAVSALRAHAGGANVLLPRLRAGQSMQYRVTARLQRKTTTESRVATMLKNPDLYRDLSGDIGLYVKQVRMDKGRPVVSATTRWIEADPIPGGDAPKRVVEFRIGADGDLAQEEGLDELDAEQRVAWQFWLARFALGWALPPEGVKPGDKWKTREDEKAGSPIAGLYWEKETTYAHDDTCPVIATETCAVFLTEATLKQRSSSKDATPDDYKVRELKTMGSVKGKNEAITYISRKTGLLMRATEDAQQEMNVVIMKTDGSNGVHYKLGATSHQEAVLVVDAGK